MPSAISFEISFFICQATPKTVGVFLTINLPVDHVNIDKHLKIVQAWPVLDFEDLHYKISSNSFVFMIS